MKNILKRVSICLMVLILSLVAFKGIAKENNSENMDPIIRELIEKDYDSLEIKDKKQLFNNGELDSLNKVIVYEKAKSGELHINSKQGEILIDEYTKVMEKEMKNILNLTFINNYLENKNIDINFSDIFEENNRDIIENTTKILIDDYRNMDELEKNEVKIFLENYSENAFGLINGLYNDLPK